MSIAPRDSIVLLLFRITNIRVGLRKLNVIPESPIARMDMETGAVGGNGRFYQSIVC